MPYQLTEEAAFVRVVFFDDMTGHDLRSLADLVAAIERERAVAPNRLTDLSQITGAQLTYTNVFDFVEHRKRQQLANSVKSAIVAPRPVQLGFARMFQTLNDHPQIEIQIFPTLAEAEAWLASA